MKRALALVVLLAVVVSVFAFAAPAMAVKPASNLAAAQHVDWNLSGAVMPVAPFGPYGTKDIPGSDVASKLIVNQPNGNTEVMLNGVMAGLTPLTTYTVYLSNGYTPYVQTGWNVAGTYTVALDVDGTPYTEYLTLTQSGSAITGTFVALNSEGTSSRWNIDGGSVVGDVVTINMYYTGNAAMRAVWVLNIAADGSMSGSWHDVLPGTRSGLLDVTVGTAVMGFTGGTGWPGLYSASIPAFAFTTDEFGAGNWHLNLRDALLPGMDGAPAQMSVWINDGATILISDPFTVVK
jgi:hypothetical protein